MQYYIKLTRSPYTCTLHNHSGMQFSTVVFHILLMRLPMETSDILRKIGGHVVFAESQSGAFHTVIPQSILRITQFRKL